MRHESVTAVPTLTGQRRVQQQTTAARKLAEIGSAMSWRPSPGPRLLHLPPTSLLSSRHAASEPGDRTPCSSTRRRHLSSCSCRRRPSRRWLTSFRPGIAPIVRQQEEHSHPRRLRQACQEQGLVRRPPRAWKLILLHWSNRRVALPCSPGLSSKTHRGHSFPPASARLT